LRLSRPVNRLRHKRLPAAIGPAGKLSATAMPNGIYCQHAAVDTGKNERREIAVPFSEEECWFECEISIDAGIQYRQDLVKEIIRSLSNGLGPTVHGNQQDSRADAQLHTCYGFVAALFASAFRQDHRASHAKKYKCSA